MTTQTSYLTKMICKLSRKLHLLLAAVLLVGLIGGSRTGREKIGRKSFIQLVAIMVLAGLFAGLAWGMLDVGPTWAAPPPRPLAIPGDCEVTTDTDSGPGSLRSCILGLQPGATITFNLTAFPTIDPMTISLNSALPVIITDNITIDGSNTGVVLDGSALPFGNGLTIDGVSDVTIKGLQILYFPANGVSLQNGATGNIIGGSNGAPGGTCSGDCNLISGNGSHGVYIAGTGTMSNTISGNYIGSDVNGAAVVGNGNTGVFIGTGATFNIVGGNSFGERNLISGNGLRGVSIEGSGVMSNTITGNFVGTDRSGSARLPNDWGIEISMGASKNTLTNNLISGNQGEGVLIRNTGTTFNKVQGNQIGTTITGTVSLSNSTGILIYDNAQFNLIGGENATPGGNCTGECNLVSGNSEDGVLIENSGTASNTVSGNYIGVDVSGTLPLGNAGDGVDLAEMTMHNFIGGDTPGQRNVISANGDNGVQIGFEAMTNTVSGNFIGTNISGTGAISNHNHGIFIGWGAQYNTVGGQTTGAGNLISGNGENGVEIQGSGTMSNTVSGNFIGINETGVSALPNKAGIFIRDGAQYNVIGGSTTVERNIISGNGIGETEGSSGIGIGFNDPETKYNRVIGNYIGLNATGTATIGNQRPGVDIWGASQNYIGGVASGEGNVIAGNGSGGGWGPGVHIGSSSGLSNTVQGNLIGTDPSGTGAMGNAFAGVHIDNGASYNLVGDNLISGNSRHGVSINGSGTNFNQISGNYIGTNMTGTGTISNLEQGVRIESGAQFNLIGGSNATPGGACTGGCNLVSGNVNGIWIQGTNTNSNTVSGNYIGTDINGTTAISNAVNGVTIFYGPQHNVIGGTTAGERNVVAAGGNGVSIEGQDTTYNVVIGNYLGTDATGTQALGHYWNGAQIRNGAQYNRIGGSSPNERNIISGNENGVQIGGGPGTDENLIIGNYIGLDANGGVTLGNHFNGVYIWEKSQLNRVETNIIVDNLTGIWVDGDATTNNTITQNSIYSNTAKGIELTDGGNLELFPPILTDVSTNTIQGQAPPNSRVEFFSDAEDEGRYYHGFAMANSSGDFSFAQANAFTGTNVSATATDSNGRTSEFSAPYEPFRDVSVVAILQPKSSGKEGEAVIPAVKIGNAGTTVENGITVSVSASGSALNSDYIPPAQTSVSLPPLGFTTLTFPAFTPDTSGSYSFVATVSLAGDEDNSNDQKNLIVAVSSSVIDLWTKDNAADTGDLPTYSFWQSPDIWVRNQNDGQTEHQAPIAGQENYVYMIVRNQGDAASSGSDTAKVYWHEPSLGIKCGDWAEIGSQPIASTVAQTGTTLLTFTWTPTRSGHTCLQGEIVSDDDPIVNECNVPWDNNLSQRNVEIITSGAGTAGQDLGVQAAGEIVFEVTNIKNAPKPIDLIVDVSNVPDANAVTLDLGQSLAGRWTSVDGYSQSSGVFWNGGSLITVTNASSGTIAGIPMKASETQTVTMLVDAPSVDTTTVTIYEAIDAGLGVSAADTIVGGNTYILSSDVQSVFLPTILKNK